MAENNTDKNNNAPEGRPKGTPNGQKPKRGWVMYAVYGIIIIALGGMLLKQDGATVIEVEDKAPWVEACQPTIQENTAAQAELYQQILDMQ